VEAESIHQLTPAYALDALDADEEREYEEHLARCPRCREDLAAFSEAASSLDRERSAREQEQRVVSIVGSPTSRKIPLSGSHGSLVVSRSGAAALVVSGVVRAPSGKTYECWVIQRGTPHRAGTFAGGEEPSAVRLTRPVPEGAIVAITLERAPGVNAPTRSPLTAAQA